MNDRETNTIQNNVFDIADADSHSCEVYIYETSHDVLIVKVTMPENSIKISFTETQYFSGTMTWQGANFRLHPHKECLELLERYKPELVKFYRDLGMLDAPFYKLYSVETKEGNLIQIIAASARVIAADDES
jgi:hypothetical protein